MGPVIDVFENHDLSLGLGQRRERSTEPPPELLDFVVAAVETTNPWYRRQKEIERRKRQPREAIGWHLVSLWPT